MSEPFTYCGFEQGPIRPPSEAGSVLVRVSRNCPWNRCAFCPVYKGSRFSLRPVEEVLADLERMREIYGDAPRTVFLQDANPLLTPADDLVAVLEAVHAHFPRAERVTAYARSHTLARRKPEELIRIREAGLHRLHVGMESGCDEVLALVSKGSTREEHIAGGRRAKDAGFELSEYVMPGLGGRRLTAGHADDSASALVAIRPDFIRLRSTTVIPGTPLHELEKGGRFEPLSEAETVAEIRRFLSGLDGLETRIESDHMMNLLMEIHGNLPADLHRLVETCDRFLEMPERDQERFILARRLNLVHSMDDRGIESFIDELDRLFERIEEEGSTLEEWLRRLKMRMV